MNDLISRSKAISVLEQLEEHSLTGKMDISNAIYLLNNQTTAYSVDKVVEELEELRDRYDDGIKNFAIRGIIEKAIEIVKHGCVADVCEWKQTSTARYKTGCGYKVEEYFDTNARYCKQCGKKIKVV